MRRAAPVSPAPGRSGTPARGQAATATAYQTWREDESFDDYTARLRRCLDQAAPRR